MSSRPVLVTLVLLAIALALPEPALAAKDYRAVRYDVTLDIEPGGAMVVTETIRFAFGPDSFTYVTRELPSRRSDGVSVLAAWMDGREMTRGTDPGEFGVKRIEGGLRRVRWYFDPVTASEHTFTVRYRVAGVVRQGTDADILEWRALPAEHAYAIGCATLDVTYPREAALVDHPVVTPPASGGLDGAGRARFERCGFDSDESWVVRLSFAPRSIAPTPPDWQRRSQQAQQKLPALLGVSLMILASGIGAFVVFGLNQRPAVARRRHSGVTSPPDRLPPVLGGALAEDGRTTWKPVLGTVLDLARRGVVTIKELPAARLKPRDFQIADTGGAVALHPTERAIYDVLFETRDGRRPALKFSELSGIRGSTSRWTRIVEAVSAGLSAEGLIDPERARTRSRGMAVAVVVIAVGIVGLVAAVPVVRHWGGATLLPGAALVAVGLIGLAIGHGVTPLTDEAQRRAARWQAYGRHLEALSQSTSAPARQVGFDRLLPLAVAFGVGAAWAKALHKQGVTAAPNWLHTLPADGGATDHMRAALDMLSSGDAAGAHGGPTAAGTPAVAGGGSSSAG